MANNSMSNSLNSLSGVTPESIYLDNINRDMANYKFTKNHKYKVRMGTGDGLLETFPPMEEGSPNNPRHPDFGPAGENGLTGIEIRNATKVKGLDAALELFHVDPVAHKAREYIKSSLTPDQFDSMRNEFKDYDMSMGMDMHPDDAMNNGVDSLLRAYMGQAPQEANDAMNYSPTQRAVLGNLQNYMNTGEE